MGARLADGIYEVDFIQSTGVQYVDTGVIPNSETSIEVDARATQNGQGIYGAHRMLNLKGVSNAYFSWKDSSIIYTNVDYLQRHTYKQDKNVCYVDGAEVGSFTYSVWSINYSLFLFGRNNGSGVLEDSAPCVIYSCKIWDDGVLVRDYVPCYNKNLEQFGLYDAVEGVFYGNLGTGTFYSKTFFEEGEDIKFLSYEQYFVDNEIVNDVSTTTITGSGTESDPYILNSTEDFWWASKYQSWNQKYVELNCDVVLNEETFDKNGNVVAGTSVDDKVYRWCRGAGRGSGSINFDGRDHTVFGMYRNLETENKGALFCGYFAKLQNLKMAHVFTRETTSASAFSSSESTGSGIYENCHLLSGFVIGGAYAGGLFIGTHTVISCSNYASVSSTTGGTGGISVAGSVFYNVKNYGSVVSSSNAVAGICGEFGRTQKYSYCENYGEITGNYAVAGITPGSTYDNTVKEIIHCKNYGKINGQSAAGIIGLCRGKAIINHCENYGAIASNGGYGGAIVGRIVYSSDTNSSGDVILTNCYAKSSGGLPFVYMVQGTGKIMLENNVYEIENHRINYATLVAEIDASVKDAILVKNFKLKVDGTGATAYLFFRYYSNNTYISMENIFVETTYRVNTLWPSSTKLGKFDGIIIKTPTQKWFYGSNFSGFNISWKTGAISLNSMSSQGSFAPRLTEENLIGMGYQKQTI